MMKSKHPVKIKHLSELQTQQSNVSELWIERWTESECQYGVQVMVQYCQC